MLKVVCWIILFAVMWAGAACVVVAEKLKPPTEDLLFWTATTVFVFTVGGLSLAIVISGLSTLLGMG